VVLDSAKAKGLRSGENRAAWRGHLSMILPGTPKLSRPHHAALAYCEVPAFVASRGCARARHRNGGKAKTVVANDPEDLKRILKLIGGSKSDWNIVLADQTSLTLWLKRSGKETSDRLIRATMAGLVGIGPKDELEG
jgi:hypothetical protein